MTTDATAWFLLAVVLAITGASTVWVAVVTVAGTVAFAAALLLALRPTLARSSTWATLSGKPAAVLPVVVIGALLSAGITQLLGVPALIGAFLFGMSVPLRAEARDLLRERIGSLTNAVLLPLFFVIVGLATKVGALGSDLGAWAWFVAILALAVGSKIGGSAVAAWAMGTSREGSMQLGVLMNCRGLTELVVLGVGLELGLLTDQLFTILVLVALVSTAMTMPLIRRMQRANSSTGSAQLFGGCGQSGHAANFERPSISSYREELK